MKEDVIETEDATGIYVPSPTMHPRKARTGCGKRKESITLANQEEGMYTCGGGATAIHGCMCCVLVCQE